jgi:hypothetical protein
MAEAPSQRILWHLGLDLSKHQDFGGKPFGQPESLMVAGKNMKTTGSW